MSVDLKFDTRHALEVIDDLCRSYKTNPSFTQRPTKLFILPDRLSITQLKTYLIKSGHQEILNDIELTTFEGLAYELLDPDVSIIDNELLKYIVKISIQNMIDPISKKLNDALQNVSDPEDSEIISSILAEFGEYSTIISPYFRDPMKVQKTIRKLGARRGGVFTSKSKEVLGFFEQLEATLQKTKTDIGISQDVFLSRAHLVGFAAKKIQNLKIKDIEYLEKIKELYVIGIPIFDTTVLDFLAVLLNKIQNGHIVAFEKIVTHLQSRLREIMGTRFPKRTNTIQSQKIKRTTQKVRLPDRRREIEYAALKAIQHIQPKKGGNISELVLVSRLTSDYAPYFDSVFQEFGLPTYVQARISMVFSPAYRLVESILKLIVHAENKTRFSASEISMPLRLGYPHRRSTRFSERITDKRYLIIETNLERLQRYHGPGSVTSWIKRINDAKSRSTGKNPSWTYDSPIQLLEWVQALGESAPDIKEIRNLVQRFVKIYGTQREYPSLGLVPGIRFEITKEHISSEATRILQDLNTLQKHMRLIKEARKLLSNRQRVRSKWVDFYGSYVGVIGGNTYGQIHRDSNAVVFLDAGISHFKKSKIRIILGLNNEQFPRKFPEPFLLYNELRLDLTDAKSGHFINNSQFHHIAEEYLLRVAEGTAEEVYYLMNFLDESGHKQHWSSLVDEGKDDQVHAHELRVEISELLQRKKTSSVSTALFDIMRSMRGGGVANLPRVLATSFQPIMQKGNSDDEINAILTSSNAMQERVIDGEFQPHIGIGSSKVLDLVFDPDRVPSLWELDLVLYCPAAYYFYTFYHLIPNQRWIERTLNITGKGSEFLRYVPLYKSRNRTGPAPRSVWRTHLSHKSVNWIIDTLGTQQRKLMSSQSSKCRTECQKLQISPAEKGAIDDLLSYLESERSNFKFKPPRQSRSLKLWIPITLEIPSKRNPSRKVQTVPYKLQPIPRPSEDDEGEPFNMTILEDTSHYQAIKFRSTRMRYKEFDVKLNDAKSFVLDRQKFISHISKMKLSHNNDNRPSYDEEVCKQCIYHSLCGVWGF